MIAIGAVDARRFLAEEIRVSANIRSAPIVDALATVPRERFLPPGPWQIRGMADLGAPPAGPTTRIRGMSITTSRLRSTPSAICTTANRA